MTRPGGGSRRHGRCAIITGASGGATSGRGPDAGGRPCATGRGFRAGSYLPVHRDGGRIAGLVTALTSITALRLRSRLCRADAGADPCFTTDATEQTRSRFLHDLELGIALVDAELVERVILGFCDRAPGRLDPFHRGVSSLDVRDVG
jgi:hypothetical protein